MVHSQGVVFGYGAIIPIEVFVGVFPGSFVFYNGWVPNTIERMNTDLIKFIYQGETTSTVVFITTAGAADYGFEKGYIFNDFTNVDMERIIQEAHQVRPWLEQTFPGNTQGFYIYGMEYG